MMAKNSGKIKGKVKEGIPSTGMKSAGLSAELSAESLADTYLFQVGGRDEGHQTTSRRSMWNMDDENKSKQ